MRLTLVGFLVCVSVPALAAETGSSSGMEVVRIKEQLPAPATKPMAPERTINVSMLPHNDQLIESDASAVVWLMATVDARGVVTDTQVMKSPAKLRLDNIAVAQVNARRFPPALDAAGRPSPSHVLVKVEWQPYWSQKMGELLDAPCAGDGPLNLALPNPTYRVCDRQ
jgi:Gram-negative bacterial TonB protein C-terminal